VCCSCTVRQCVAACCNVLGQSIRHYRMYCGNQYFLGAVQVWTRCKSGPDESHESCHMCMSHESCHMCMSHESCHMCRRKSGPDESHESCHMCMSHESCHMCRRKSAPDESHESCHMCMSHESCHMCRRKSGPDESHESCHMCMSHESCHMCMSHESCHMCMSHESCHMCISHESCHMCRRKSAPDESLPGFKSTDGVHGNIDCELHEFRITNNHKYRVYRDSILIYYNHQWFTTTIEEFPPLGPCSLLQSSPLQSVAV